MIFRLYSIFFKEKIQELRQTDKTIDQILDEIQDPPNAKKYEMLNINPIKDINLNPFEVAEALKVKYPNLSDADYISLGKKWGISPEYFGIKEPSKDILADQLKVLISAFGYIYNHRDHLDLLFSDLI